MTPLIGVTCGARRLDGKELTYAYRNYLQAVTAAGGLPLLLGPDTPPALAPEAMARLDGLLLTGGEDVDPSSYGRARREVCGPSDPLRDAFEIAALQACRVLGKPVLGICRGMQLMTVAMGGTQMSQLKGRSFQGFATAWSPWEFPLPEPPHSIRSVLNTSSRVPPMGRPILYTGW